MRFGLFSLLFVREFSYYLVTQYTCLIASYVLLNFPITPAELAKTVFFEFPLSEWLFIIGYVSHISKIIITYLVSGPLAYPTPIELVASSAPSS
jgi:hypothetical protein